MLIVWSSISWTECFSFHTDWNFSDKKFRGSLSADKRLYDVQNVTAANDMNIFSDSVCNSHFPINSESDGLWSGGTGQLLLRATVSFSFEVN